MPVTSALLGGVGGAEATDPGVLLASQPSSNGEFQVQ